MSKETRINVRTTDQIKRELKIAAKLRGLSESALVNSLVVKAIREEKQVAPDAFGALTNRPQDIDQISESSDQAVTPAWQQGLRKAKGMWKDRTDLPKVSELRREADRSDRWDRD